MVGFFMLLMHIFISAIDGQYYEKSDKIYKYYMNDILINPPESICDPPPDSPGHINVMLRESHVQNVAERIKCRNVLTPAQLRSLNIVQVFLLAGVTESKNVMNRSVTQKDIERESFLHGDILQGNFTDHIRNMTHKHLMGLRWVTDSCRQARFIIKIDDFIESDLGTLQELSHYFRLANRLAFDRTNVLRGFIKKAVPIRDPKLEYCVTREEYPGDKYPSYVWGSYYMTTPEVAESLCHQAQFYPYLYIHDVFITGILREAAEIEVKAMETIIYKYDIYDYEEYKNEEYIQPP